MPDHRVAYVQHEGDNHSVSAYYVTCRADLGGCGWESQRFLGNDGGRQVLAAALDHRARGVECPTS